MEFPNKVFRLIRSDDTIRVATQDVESDGCGGGGRVTAATTTKKA